MIVIAGRTVQLGDPLYHTGFKAWGTVVGFDTGSARLQIIGANAAPRILYVQTGGMVNGRRVIYWHEPLTLDLPVQNIGKYQAIVNALVSEFSP
jgi:hypothetical protein